MARLLILTGDRTRLKKHGRVGSKRRSLLIAAEEKERAV
jgi:hypothetical protein